MNRTYRVIFNKATNSWQAVTELAKSFGKSKSSVSTDAPAVHTSRTQSWLLKGLAVGVIFAAAQTANAQTQPADSGSGVNTPATGAPATGTTAPDIGGTIGKILGAITSPITNGIPGLSGLKFTTSGPFSGPAGPFLNIVNGAVEGLCNGNAICKAVKGVVEGIGNAIQPGWEQMLADKISKAFTPAGWQDPNAPAGSTGTGSGSEIATDNQGNFQVAPWQFTANGAEGGSIAPGETMDFASSNNSINITPQANGKGLDFEVNVDNDTIVVDKDGQLTATGLDNVNVNINGKTADTLVKGDSDLNFVNGQGTDVMVNDGNISFDVVDAGVGVNRRGQATDPRNSDGFVSGQDFTDTVNNLSWTTTVNGDAATPVKAGDTVDFVDGQGTLAKRNDDGSITFDANVDNDTLRVDSRGVLRADTTVVATVNGKDDIEFDNKTPIDFTNGEGTTARNDAGALTFDVNRSRIVTDDAGKFALRDGDPDNGFVTGDQIVRSLNSVRDEAQDNLDVAQADNQRVFRQFGEDTSKALNDLRNEAKGDLAAAQAENKRNFGLLVQDTNKALNDVRNDARGDLAAAQAENKKNFGDLVHDTNEALNTVRNDARSDLAAAQATNDQRFAKNDERFGNFVHDTNEALNDVRDGAHNELAAAQAENRKVFGDFVFDTNKALNEVRNDAKNDLATAQADNQKNFGMLVHDTNEALNDVRNDAKGDLAAAQAKNDERFGMLVHDTNEALNDVREGAKDDLATAVAEGKERFGSFVHDTNEALNKVRDDAKNDLAAAQAENHENFGNLVHDTNLALNKVRDDAQSNLNAAQAENRDALNKLRDDTKHDLASAVADSNDRFGSFVHDTNEALNKVRDDAKGDLAAAQAKNDERFGNFVHDTNEALNDVRDGAHNELAAAQAQNKETFGNFVHDTNEALNKVRDDARGDLAVAQAKNDEKFGQFVHDTNDALNDVRDTAHNELTQAQQQNEQALGEVIRNTNDGLNLVSNKINTVQSNLDAAQAENKETFGQFVHDTNAALNDVRDTAQNNLIDFKNQTNTALGEVIRSTNDGLNTVSSRIDTVQSSLDNIKAENQQNFGNFVHETNDALNKVQGNIDTVQNNLDTAQAQNKEVFGQFVYDTNEALNDVRSTAQNNLNAAQEQNHKDLLALQEQTKKDIEQAVINGDSGSKAVDERLTNTIHNGIGLADEEGASFSQDLGTTLEITGDGNLHTQVIDNDDGSKSLQVGLGDRINLSDTDANAKTELSGQGLNLASGEDTAAQLTGDSLKFIQGTEDDSNRAQLGSQGLGVSNRRGAASGFTADGIMLEDELGNKGGLSATALSFTPLKGNQVVLDVNGLDNGGNRILNVANGKDASDAVNFGQLQAVEKNAQSQLETATKQGQDALLQLQESNRKDLASAEEQIQQRIDKARSELQAALDEQKALGNKETTAGAATSASGQPAGNGPISLTDNAGTSVTLSGDALTFKPKEGSSVTLGSRGLDNGGNAIRNVGNGEIAANSRDAVNGGQLYLSDQRIDQLQGRVDQQSAALNKGLAFSGDAGPVVSRPLGSQVSITGGVTEPEKLTDNNIGVVSNGRDSLQVKLAKDLTGLNSVSMGPTVLNSQGLAINADNPANTVSLTASGLNNGNYRISQVAPAVYGTDAVNLNQMTSQMASMGQQFNSQLMNVNNNLSGAINRTDNNARSGVASALAAAGLPDAQNANDKMVSIAGGVYRGEAGYALGISTVTENNRFVLKAIATGDSRNNFGASAGAGFKWQ